MCILIDGLDESGDRDRNVLTEVLTKYAVRMPKWLRIMAFSRKVEVITGLSGGADTIDLTGGLEENVADIRAYFEYRLSGRFGGDENYTAMIDSLSENSGGIFLYATLMADALAKGKMSIEDTGSVPDRLDNAFYRWFQWFLHSNVGFVQGIFDEKRLRSLQKCSQSEQKQPVKGDGFKFKKMHKHNRPVY